MMHLHQPQWLLVTLHTCAGKVLSMDTVCTSHARGLHLQTQSDTCSALCPCLIFAQVMPNHHGNPTAHVLMNIAQPQFP